MMSSACHVVDDIAAQPQWLEAASDARFEESFRLEIGVGAATHPIDPLRH